MSDLRAVDASGCPITVGSRLRGSSEHRDDEVVSAVGSYNGVTYIEIEKPACRLYEPFDDLVVVGGDQ